MKESKTLQKLCEALNGHTEAAIQLERAEDFIGRLAPRGEKSLKAFEIVRQTFRSRKRAEADQVRLWLEKLEDEIAAAKEDGNR